MASQLGIKSPIHIQIPNLITYLIVWQHSTHEAQKLPKPLLPSPETGLRHPNS